MEQTNATFQLVEYRFPTEYYKSQYPISIIL